MDATVKDWLSSIDRKRQWPGKPRAPALLVLDMQNFFLDMNSHAFVPTARSILPRIVKTVRDFTGPVIFTRHMGDADKNNLMNIWWRDAITGESSHIVPELEPYTSEILKKKHYSAFYKTNLEDILSRNGADAVFISGIMTDLCCETTARDAFMRGYRVYFIADATATITEARHVATLAAIARGFGEVITSEEMRWLL